MSGCENGRELNPLIQRAVFSLDDKRSFDIVTKVLNCGPQSFTMIKEEFSLNSNEATRTLQKLMLGSLVIRRFRDKTEDNHYSFYDATSLAANIFQKLHEVQSPGITYLKEQSRFYYPTSEIDPFDEEIKKLVYKWTELRDSLHASSRSMSAPQVMRDKE